MMYTKKDIDKPTADFEQCQKYCLLKPHELSLNIIA